MITLSKSNLHMPLREIGKPAFKGRVLDLVTPGRSLNLLQEVRHHGYCILDQFRVELLRFQEGDGDSGRLCGLTHHSPPQGGMGGYLPWDSLNWPSKALKERL